MGPHNLPANLNHSVVNLTLDNGTGTNNEYEIIPCNNYTPAIAGSPLCNWTGNWYSQCFINRYFVEGQSTQTFSFPGLPKNNLDADRSDCNITQYKLKYNDTTENVFKDWGSST